MTTRQAKYKTNRLMGMDMYNAAIKAGYSIRTAQKAAHAVEPMAGIKDELVRAGATHKVLAEALVNIALTADRLQSCNVYVKKDSDGKYQINENSNDFIYVPDTMSRLQAIRQITDLMKLSKENGNGQGATIETFLIETIKKRQAALNNGEAIRITRIESRELDGFLAK